MLQETRRKMPGRFARCAMAGMLIFAALLVAACVTEYEKPLTRVELTVTRSDDVVTLRWKTKIGETYIITYADSFGAGARWNALPGCERVAGTGDFIEKNDSVPINVRRYYNIDLISAAK